MTQFNERPTPYRPTKGHKAIVAGIALFIAYLTAAFGDDVLNWGEVGEGIALLIELVGGAVAVYVKSNPPKLVGGAVAVYAKSNPPKDV